MKFNMLMFSHCVAVHQALVGLWAQEDPPRKCEEELAESSLALSK